MKGLILSFLLDFEAGEAVHVLRDGHGRCGQHCQSYRAQLSLTQHNTGEHSLYTDEHCFYIGEHSLYTDEHSLDIGERSLYTDEHSLYIGEHSLYTDEHSLYIMIIFIIWSCLVWSA